MKLVRMSRKGAYLSLFLLAFGLCNFNAAQAADAPKKITFVAGTVGGAWYNSAAVMAQPWLFESEYSSTTAILGG